MSSTANGKSNSNLQSIFCKTLDNNQFVEVNEAEVNRHEQSLRNTFGWMRIEILTMLISGIFLGAFCFSLLVEALQTLIHIDHQDTMHYPMPVFLLAISGLALNVFCYFLIGGYTYHQSSFLHLTSAGDVVLEQVASRDGLYHGSRNLAKIKRSDNNQSASTAIQSIHSASIQHVAQTNAIQSNATHYNVQPQHTFNELLRDVSSMYYSDIDSTHISFVTFFIFKHAFIFTHRHRICVDLCGHRQLCG